ncbi:MAG: tRNA (guanosine(37)-N1)-methyltransferase TrmD [Eubacterium sp.]|nr:tRNA (guanosine(37)-N1)-methyltransferase TrmD [Eubacterium sp.]
MNFYVLTLFPELIDTIVNTSITGRAVRNGSLHVETINIRDFSVRKTNRVDDYPYGGGAGMVMEAEPVYRAVRSVEEKAGTKPRVVYMTPQAEVLNQTKVESLAQEKDLILLCGHYEGIDERVLQEVVTDYISIGDYVLTGGELGAAVLIDAVSRFVPGVLSNEESSQFESLQDNLLEYPQFTRPEEWHGEKVPQVLLSGDHKKIEAWRHEQSLIRTRERRPDLLKKSYRVSAVTYGGVDPAYAESLTGHITRYGEMFDYNRRKLQKTRRTLSERDLLLLFTDKNSGADAGNLSEPFRNLFGKGTPLIPILPEVEELSDEEKNFFEKRGFCLLESMHSLGRTGEEEQTKDALEIREKVLHFAN